MKRLVCGILAHVDSGKTTLSEAMLYTCGMIRRAGRVDKKDAFLDHYELERERGITIFSKQALLNTDGLRITLIDTPGHVDFCAETERALQILDYAVLLVSAPDGVQGHTETLFRLLGRYRIPVFVFVNKTDQPCPKKRELMRMLCGKLSASCVDFSEPDTGGFFEQVSLCNENALERYLADGTLSDGWIADMIVRRELFPCFFGSALRMEGVRELIEGLARYTRQPAYGEGFAAKVYKIGRDEQGNRLTYLKLTGGTLAVRDTVSYRTGGERVGEKVNQIRIYSGARYEAPAHVQAGEVCAVTGLTGTRAGEGLGGEEDCAMPVLIPVMTCRLILPEGEEPLQFLPKLRQIEDEEPQLHVVWNERLSEIHVQLMGEVQTEVLEKLIRDRFQVSVRFGPGKVVYRETLAEAVEGVGHFEPLRHYAEVHLYMEPGERGSGLVFASACSEDVLARSWQRLILTHLAEKEHVGVLTGAPITDMKITLVSGRAHVKHTEGGDFRQATYRAVRQGLRSAKCVLLEPYYRFRVSVPANQIGRVMSDMERMNAEFEAPEGNADRMELTGIAAVAAISDYAKELAAFTKGLGRISLSLYGYERCRREEAVIADAGYDPDADIDNPCGSVFCAHGGGYQVPWDSVREHMHLPLWSGEPERPGIPATDIHPHTWEHTLGTEEIDEIIARSGGANRKEKSAPRKDERDSRPDGERRREAAVRGAGQNKNGEEYLLVDGYNVIFAWEELQELASVCVDAARTKLLDVLCNYQAMCGGELTVVFDAYRVQGHAEEAADYHNIHVVFTKEAETADQYIEKFAYQNHGKYRITVATSDGLEQTMIRGQGCALLSARELYERVARVSEAFRREHMARTSRLGNTLEARLSEQNKETGTEEET